MIRIMTQKIYITGTAEISFKWILPRAVFRTLACTNV